MRNRERILQVQAAYRAAHKEQTAVYNKEYKRINPPDPLPYDPEKRRKKYLARREKQLAQQKIYREQNHEKLLAKKREYEIINKTKILEKKRAVYAFKKDRGNAAAAVVALSHKFQYCERFKLKAIHLPCGDREECVGCIKRPKKG